MKGQVLKFSQWYRLNENNSNPVKMAFIESDPEGDDENPGCPYPYPAKLIEVETTAGDVIEGLRQMGGGNPGWDKLVYKSLTVGMNYPYSEMNLDRVLVGEDFNDDFPVRIEDYEKAQSDYRPLLKYLMDQGATVVGSGMIEEGECGTSPSDGSVNGVYNGLYAFTSTADKERRDIRWKSIGGQSSMFDLPGFEGI